VVAGGSGARNPRIATTIEEFTGKERVLAILKKVIAALRNAPLGETLKTIVERQGPESLR
jgi:sulfite reductase beta subunit-like hemoprotein